MDRIVDNIFDSENSEYTFESCGTNNRVIFYYNYDNFEWFQFFFAERLQERITFKYKMNKNAIISSTWNLQKLIFFNWITHSADLRSVNCFRFARHLALNQLHSACMYDMHFALEIQFGWRKHNCVGICYTSRVLILL